ncbi:acylase [Robiginitalea sp. M366]|uniref:acylase n=1 Tax=Robiginitalea aestuariiviva TaxID=3036903 RepID=UPI00240D07BB|nr:acylase [Robiginitalea aestuariiviva]MDG1571794.1 acylase [Robiginitalea aestuariiviva]
MRTLKYFVFVAFVSLVSCRQAPPTEAEQWEARASRITIHRDDFGVPHIYARTDADAVFGMLYAQCEDDFNRVEQNYIWAIGRLAEVEGEDALYSDLRARMFMSREEAMEAYRNSPPWLQALCDAFADGINYYLHTHPEVKPRLLTRFEPWMPMYFSEGSIGGDIERISTRKIRAYYEEGAELPRQEVEALERQAAEAEPQGSNGIAIAGALTQSGNAMLLINPHTSFYFRGEIHVVSEEGLNAYGAVTWGQFFIYQGFNEKTGWMHTSTYTDVMDEFLETVAVSQTGEPVYQYGEVWRPVQASEVTLAYASGDSLAHKTFPLYRTHHGPITHQQEGKPVASAMMWDPARALEQAFIRTKQDGYEGFRQMMDIRTNSSNNTVYADADGNIAYFHGNFIPRRDPRFNYREPVDGSNPDTDWQGLHTVDENILVLNPPNGWIQNCNSTPYTSALEYSPKREDYPGYMSLDRENFRGVHAIELLKGRSGYTLDSLIALAYDPYLPAFEALIPGLVEAFDRNPAAYPELRDPVEVLRAWDFRTSEQAVGMTLAHFYGTRYAREGEAPEGLTPMETLTYFGADSPGDERLGVFARTVAQLESDFGRWDVPWGEVNRYQRLNGDLRQAFDDAKPSIPVGLASGRWGALAAYGARYHNNTKKIYGTRGNSFVAVVEFGDRVKAKTLLAGGQSGDPDSPHFDDQAQRYADAKFKDVPYYKEDVMARARETYHPGERRP